MSLDYPRRAGKLLASDWALAEFLERAQANAPAIIAAEGIQPERRPTLTPREARMARFLERPTGHHQATTTHREA